MSGNIKLLLILIVSLQACLLQAKSLRAAETSAPESLSDPENVSNYSSSVCSSEQYQLAMDQYYSELYSTNVANTFSGNMMYYALKAMETHRNSNQAVITAEDHAVIASFSDQGKFIPAGMDLANKVICAKMLQEMDTVVSHISTTALCPWNYTCDYKANRFPNYLIKAKCLHDRCRDVTCSQYYDRHSMCQSHSITVNVLRMRDNCESWDVDEEFIPLACTCTNDVVSNTP